jgi:hypothetical protein
MTPTATLSHTADVQSASRIRRFAVRHPVGSYMLLAYPIAWTLRVGLTLVGAPNQLSETAATLVGIAAPAVLITYWGSGRASVRRLGTDARHDQGSSGPHRRLLHVGRS